MEVDSAKEVLCHCCVWKVPGPVTPAANSWMTLSLTILLGFSSFPLHSLACLRLSSVSSFPLHRGADTRTDKDCIHLHMNKLQQGRRASEEDLTEKVILGEAQRSPGLAGGLGEGAEQAMIL